jgi:hypothetical protein
LWDHIELNLGLDPTLKDSDGDGVRDVLGLLGAQPAIDFWDEDTVAWIDPSADARRFTSVDMCNWNNPHPNGEWLDLPHPSFVGMRYIDSSSIVLAAHVDGQSMAEITCYANDQCRLFGSHGRTIVYGDLDTYVHPPNLTQSASFRYEWIDWFTPNISAGNCVRTEAEDGVLLTVPTLASGRHRWGTDPDGDGLSTLQEQQIGSSPLRWDSDGDGLPDHVEIAYGFDPTTPNSGSLPDFLDFWSQ